jgi:ribonuclease HII
MTILGVDEAGRGPLAGPVAMGIVRVEEGFDVLATFPGLNDSKQLSEKKREALFELLQLEVAKGTVSYKVEFGSAKDIDDEGIVPTVRMGVWRGVRVLMPECAEGKVFLDGSLKAPPEYEQETVIRGDSIVPVIMLASIAAKVTRDRYMCRVAKQFPDYGFDKHKGYGTAAHYAAIEKYGLCEEHRRTFLKKLDV